MSKKRNLFVKDAIAGHHFSLATLDDVKAYLSEHGLVAAPKSYVNFIDTCLQASRDGCSIDGAEIQDTFADIGIIEQYEAKESCGTNCICAEVDAFPQNCYRDTDDYKTMLLAAQENDNDSV